MNAIITDSEYQAATLRAISIFHAEEGTQEAKELGELLSQIKEYEDGNIQLPEPELSTVL